MLKHFYAFTENKDLEELHQMRVEIKKIDAMIWLEKKCSNSAGISEKLILFKKIFEHAGEIRAAQINLQLISKYKKIDKKYLNFQRRIITSETKHFCEISNAYKNQLTTSKQIIVKSFVDIKNKYIRHLYLKQIKRIARLLSEQNRSAQLHECRKKIKRLLYINEFLQKSLKNKLRMNIHYSQKLEDIIGKWHDLIATLGLLKKTNFGNKELITRLEDRCEITRNEITILSKNFSRKFLS